MYEDSQRDMEENALSLVMDTIGIVGIFFLAGVLLCI